MLLCGNQAKKTKQKTVGEYHSLRNITVTWDPVWKSLLFQFISLYHAHMLHASEYILL